MSETAIIPELRSPFKGWRNILFYVILIGGGGGFAYYIAKHGAKLQATTITPKAIAPASSGWLDFKAATEHNLVHPLAILILQIATIIVAAMALGYLFRKLRQPAVIGEILAGILLGPSLVGHYFPEFSAFLFPPTSLPNLQFLSQMGLILFMFVVGMELDLKVLRNQAYEAIVISHASIVIPFTLGMGLAYFLFKSFAPPGIHFLSFSLFIGIAMSITAFPVLARIVQERQLSKTKIGSLVITCAAADDITAWCMLAVVIAIVKAGSFISALYTIAIAVTYVLLMLLLVRPFLKRIGEKYADKERLSKSIVGVFFIMLLISAYTTELIGIHALFGAFMAGVIMPENANFRSVFIDKVEDVAIVLLLPLFFVFTGLRTQIGLLDDIGLWKACAVIILIAVAGKFLGSSLAARFVGQPWKESLVIGALMNTRGLMELVVLNIGYDLGILTPGVFAMMVIMALVTTFMTGPSLELINYFFRDKKILSQKEYEVLPAHKFKILISFGTASSGRSMLRLAAAFVKKSKETARIISLHLTPSSEINQYNIEKKEEEIFEPLYKESAQLGLSFEKRFKPSQDIIPEIIRIANEEACDLMLVGTSRSIYEGTVLGRFLGFTSRLLELEKLYRTLTFQQKFFEQSSFDERTQGIVDNTKVPVGIFINKKFSDAKQVLLPILGSGDQLLFIYAKKLITNNGATVTLVYSNSISDKIPEIKDTISAFAASAPNQVVVKADTALDEKMMQGSDLVLISYSSWKLLAEPKPSWLKNLPSTLIIKP